MSPILSYFRFFLVLVGFLDGVVFGHVIGPLIALVVIGVLELAAMLFDRAQMRKRREDEFRDRTQSWD